MGESLPQRTHNRSYMKGYRRELRTYGTNAEAAAWNLLKGKKIEGLQFRRQFSIEKYILDFYCPALKLAIELDGESHNVWGKGGMDEDRSNLLREKHGITVLRYENKIVYQHPEYIIEDIKRYKQEYYKVSPSKLEDEHEVQWTSAEGRGRVTERRNDTLLSQPQAAASSPNLGEQINGIGSAKSPPLK